MEAVWKPGDGAPRWKVSLGVTLLLHAAVLFGGNLLLASRVQYGMAAALAGGGPRAAQKAPEDEVDLDMTQDAPVEKPEAPKPRPMPPPPAGNGGPQASGAKALPSYFRNPPPRYPEEAKRFKQEGLVELDAQVDGQGRVGSVSVVKSSGFPLLDEAAVEAVREWRFKPATLAGLPVAASVKIPVLFRLKDAD